MSKTLLRRSRLPLLLAAILAIGAGASLLPACDPICIQDWNGC